MTQRRRSASLVDDVAGAKPSKRLTLALDGANFEVSLTKVQAAHLRQALAPYVAAARRVAGSQPTTAGLAEALAQPGYGELLCTALVARFGGQEQRLDPTVAAALGVTARTLQGWVRGRPGRPTVPARRQEQVLTALQPTAATRAREALELEQAEDGVRRVRLGARGGDLDAWRAQGWLEPHRVMVLDVGGGLRRAALSRDSHNTVTRMRRSALVLDGVVVSNRFTGALVRRAVLQAVDGWRIEARPELVAKGHTQVWLHQAPAPALQVLAARRFRVKGSNLVVCPGSSWGQPVGPDR